MMRIFLPILIILIFTFSCSSHHLLVKDINKGLYLKQAKLKSVNHFFQNRMTNYQMYKNGYIQRRWNIINEDSNFVYYAFTQHKGYDEVDVPIGSIDTLYKVNKNNLKKIFPRYREIQGFHIKDIAWKNMNHELDSELFSENCSSDFSDWQFELHKKVIIVKYASYCLNKIFFYNRSNKLYEYKFIINQYDLKLLEKERVVVGR